MLEQLLGAVALGLQPLYAPEEACALAYRLLEYQLGCDRGGLLARAHEELVVSDREAVGRLIGRLQRGEPIQYIEGQVEFAGLSLEVSPGVLIPRPETEELAMLLGREALPAGGRLLDICTGSGCLAISLAHQHRARRVEGCDISPVALELAARNARRNQVVVELFAADVLSAAFRLEPSRYALIVSNPPYVPLAELARTHVNVASWEPREAIFVPDAAPLQFYEAIAHAAREALCPGGELFFEIYPPCAEALRSLLGGLGFTGVAVMSDFSGRPRYVRARRTAKES